MREGLIQKFYAYRKKGLIIIIYVTITIGLYS